MLLLFAVSGSCKTVISIRIDNVIFSVSIRYRFPLYFLSTTSTLILHSYTRTHIHKCLFLFHFLIIQFQSHTISLPHSTVPGSIAVMLDTWLSNDEYQTLSNCFDRPDSTRFKSPDMAHWKQAHNSVGHVVRHQQACTSECTICLTVHN